MTRGASLRQEIQTALEALEIRLVTNGKDWTYLRDTAWRNIKATAKSKLDKSHETGGGGDARLNDFDKLVLDVEGIDSPAAVGLAVGETWGDANTISSGITLEENRSLPSTVSKKYFCCIYSN
jgi:hypothetical protein